MSECSHENCWTKFCPHCGQPMKKAAGDTLLAHCRARATKQRQLYERTRARCADKVAKPEQIEWRSACVRRQHKVLEKWESWVAWIEEHMDG